MDDMPVVVLDTGSSVCKAGFAGSDAPTSVFSTLVGRPQYEAKAAVDAKDVYIGNAAQEHREILSLRYPMRRGIVTDWDDMEKIWHHAYNELGASPENYAVLTTEVPLNPKPEREKTAQVMFEQFNVPSFYVQLDPLLSLYAYGRNMGIFVNSGADVTHVVAFWESYLLAHTFQRIDIGGRDVTEYLARLLAQKGCSFATPAEMETVRDIKETTCHVARIYECTEVSETEYELPDGSKIQIADEQFRSPEILFRPSLIGRKIPGLHELVYDSLMKSPIDIRRDLLVSICLSGGNTMTEGFAERLRKEMVSSFPAIATSKIYVRANPERLYSVWIGGSILASLSAFKNMIVSKQEYEEYGPCIVHKKCL